MLPRRQEIINETDGITYHSAREATEALGCGDFHIILKIAEKNGRYDGKRLSLGRKFDPKLNAWITPNKPREECLFYDECKKKCNALKKVYCIWEKCNFYKTKI